MTELIDTKKRHKTRYPGIYYRLTANNERRYIVWIRDSHGAARMITLPPGSTLDSARAYKANSTTAIRNGEMFAPSKLTISDWADRWLEEVQPKLRPKTYEGYQWGVGHVKDRLGTIRLHDLRVDDVARFISELQAAGLKTWSIRNALKPLSRMMSVAVRRGMCNQNPVKGLDKTDRPNGDQRPMRILDEEEIQRLLFSASSDRWRALFSTLIFTGLRIGEALGLVWADVDRANGLIVVRSSKTESGVRQVVVPDFVLKQLAKIWSGDVNGFVFKTKHGQPLSKRNTLRALAGACVKAGIPHVTQHELRHTYASIVIGKGFDVTLVADQLGHSDPAITLRVYAKLFNPVERRAALRDELDQAFGGRA